MSIAPPQSEPWPDLSESALDSAAFDQPEPSQPPDRYFILSQRRSGSYLLCRALIRAGLGLPHEYFQDDHRRALAARWAIPAGRRNGPAPEAYLGELVKRRSCGGYFGAKVQYWQYERVLANQQGDRFLKDARFIYLYREDLLKQAISFRHAEITGRWGSDGLVTTDPCHREDPFDPRGVDRKLNLLIHDEVGWRSFMARRGVKALHLSYEAFCADFRGVLRRVAAHLHAPAAAVDGIDPEPSSEQTQADAELKRRMLDAYLEARANHAGTSVWANPLADAVWSVWARQNGLNP